MRKIAQSKFDGNCVDALLFNAKKVKDIQAKFSDADLDLSGTGGR